MTDAVSSLPAPASRARGSFGWGLPIALACIALGHVATFQLQARFGEAFADRWAGAAFAAPFAAWALACALRRRWLALVGFASFALALALLWIFVVSTLSGFRCE